MSRLSVSFEVRFCGGKIRFTLAIVANKRANSNNLKIKKNWIYDYFPRHLRNELSQILVHKLIVDQWEWTIISVRSLTVFEEIIVVIVLVKLLVNYFYLNKSRNFLKFQFTSRFASRLILVTKKKLMLYFFSLGVR